MLLGNNCASTAWPFRVEMCQSLSDCQVNRGTYCHLSRVHDGTGTGNVLTQPLLPKLTSKLASSRVINTNLITVDISIKIVSNTAPK
ncbi:MAG: hypothetical protein AMJ53_15035 [Gammaproteobacteria bacterium SG8_11]|nr:MAG: hypothetical protein AMJ53_15035 [Gammaproteobacteria bacterium SG8_11]